MPTVSGVWVWNDGRADVPSDIRQSVNFVSNSTSYVRLDILSAGGEASLYYRKSIGGSDVAFNSSWRDTAYKTIDFGTEEQEVSQGFYDYLTANATQQEEPIVPTTTKSVSNKNLTKFKQKCDETYAGKDEIPNVPAIPTPTTSDNGKVLGVINGAYSLLNLFPVGAYYITENATTPASLFGGEWVQVKSKFLLGASVQDGYPLGTEGGEKTHTLTTAEMPQHSHKPHQFTWILPYGGNSGQNVISGGNQGNANVFNVDEDQNRYTGTAGGNQPHNNMPPYRSVFIWRRTA